MQYFRVRNFDHFQHYKRRSPSWIKLYRQLLHDYDFMCLTDAERGQLVMIWLLAAETGNVMPKDERWVRNTLAITSNKFSLNRFISLGWLEIIDTPQRLTPENDSKSLATGYQPAIPETETETETETEINLAPPLPSPRRERDETSEGEERSESDAREEGLLAMHNLLQSFGKEDPRDRNPRSTSIPKDADIQNREVIRWLLKYFPDQSPGAGAPAAVRQWMGRLTNRDIVIFKRELEGGQFKLSDNGSSETVGWTGLSHDKQRLYITAGLNAKLKTR